MDEAIACSSGRTLPSRMSRSVVAMFTFPVRRRGAGWEEPGTVRRHPVAGFLRSKSACGRRCGEKLALAPNPVPVDGAGRRGTNRTPPEAGVQARDPVDCSNGTGGCHRWPASPGIAEIAEERADKAGASTELA